MSRPNGICLSADETKLYVVGQPYVTSLPVRVAGAVARKKLTLAAAGNQINVAWPAPSTGYKLQASGSLTGTDGWKHVVEAPTVIDGMNTVNVKPAEAAKFFRLQLQ
ncbi:MAG: hypothetical protein FJ398_11060 [Verrucomicrobia bacterium]|nr:hypothetical protein [Verrucomicrobiota bacterium]